MGIELMETQLSDFEIMLPLPEDSPQDVRSEHNLKSPFQQFPEDSPQDVRNEEWGSAGHRAGPEVARWEGRCSMTM